MPEIVEIEETRTRDLDGAYRKTLIRQTVGNNDFEPNPDALQYKKNHKDSFITVTEDFIELGGEGVWQIDCTTSQEPIETHQYFASLSDQDKRNWALWKRDQTSSQLIPPNWNPASPDQNEQIQTLYYWWIRDVTSFLAPRIVARWHVVENHPPDCSGVGKIAVGWDLPSINVPEGVDFLLSGATGKQIGTGDQEWYANTYELLGSARSVQAGENETGWIKFLYQY